VSVDAPLGFHTPRFDEKTLSLGDAELNATLGSALLILQPCRSLSGDPKVDDFRHL
jgi:hypothetical protein